MSQGPAKIVHHVAFGYVGEFPNRRPALACGAVCEPETELTIVTGKETCAACSAAINAYWKAVNEAQRKVRSPNKKAEK